MKLAIQLIYAVQNLVRQATDKRVHLLDQKQLMAESTTFAKVFNATKSGFMNCYKSPGPKIIARYYNGTVKSYSKEKDIKDYGNVMSCE